MTPISVTSLKTPIVQPIMKLWKMNTIATRKRDYGAMISFAGTT